MTIKNFPKKRIPAILMLSYLIVLAVEIRIAPVFESGETFSLSFFNHITAYFTKGMIIDLILFIGFAVMLALFSNAYCRYLKRFQVWSGLIALFFSAMIPAGEVFSEGSIKILFSNPVQIAKTFIIWGGYAVLLFVIVSVIFQAINQIEKTCNVDDRLGSFFRKRSFILFIILFLLSLGVFLFFYPGILMADSTSQIFELSGHTGYYFYGDFQYAYDDSFLSNMHPLISTLFLKLCIKIGSAISGYNLGIGIFTVCQIAFMTFAVTYTSRTLAFLRVRGRYILLGVIFLYINVLYINMLYVVTKDVVFTAFLLLFVSETFLTFSGKGNTINYLLTVVWALGTAAYRGEGIYVVLIMMAVYMLALIINAFRKKAHRDQLRKVIFHACVIVGLVIVHFVWNQAVLPVLHVTPGTPVLKYSIPIQQVARCMVTNPDSITQEEYDAISAVINPEDLKARFDPYDADEVKKYFNYNCTEEELSDFMDAWKSICARKPDTAFYAWANVKYNFFCLDDTSMSIYSLSWSNKMMETLNQELMDREYDTEISYPDGTGMSNIRSDLENIAYTLCSFPIYRVLMSPSVYVLLLFIITAYILFIRRFSRLILLIPSWFILIFTNLLGATNASYGRYMYPIVVLMPFILLFALTETNQEGVNRARPSVTLSS